jgi:hypothetical protein
MFNFTAKIKFMKKYLLSFVIIALLLSCKKEDTKQSNFDCGYPIEDFPSDYGSIYFEYWFALKVSNLPVHETIDTIDFCWWKNSPHYSEYMAKNNNNETNAYKQFIVFIDSAWDTNEYQHNFEIEDLLKP